MNREPRILEGRRPLVSSFDPDADSRPARIRRAEPRAQPTGQQDALEAAAFRIFRADARDALISWNADAKRPETKDEAFARRWREMPARNRARYLNLAAVARADR